MADTAAAAASSAAAESPGTTEEHLQAPPSSDSPDAGKRDPSQGTTQDLVRHASEDDPAQPPLPDEEAPPLPDEAPPTSQPPAGDDDDGWAPIWDPTNQAFYFFNRFTQASQWENPRVPSASATDHDRPAPPLPTTTNPSSSSTNPVAGGYNPAIHGDYDPTASYARPRSPSPTSNPPPTLHPLAPGTAAPEDAYGATATFNRFTGRFQRADISAANHTDEAKSGRQLAAFFDVEGAAGAHDGRSLKAERQGRKLSKKEVKAFKDKRRERKEEKRRAWLRD